MESWLHTDIVKGNEDSALQISVDRNSTYQNRTGTITLRGEYGTVSNVTVTQKARVSTLAIIFNSKNMSEITYIVDGDTVSYEDFRTAVPQNGQIGVQWSYVGGTNHCKYTWKPSSQNTESQGNNYIELDIITVSKYDAGNQRIYDIWNAVFDSDSPIIRINLTEGTPEIKKMSDYSTHSLLVTLEEDNTWQLGGFDYNISQSTANPDSLQNGYGKISFIDVGAGNISKIPKWWLYPQSTEGWWNFKFHYLNPEGTYSIGTGDPYIGDNLDIAIGDIYSDDETVGVNMHTYVNSMTEAQFYNFEGSTDRQIIE